MTDDSKAARLLEVARTILGAAQHCFVITVSDTGQANARLVQPFAPDEALTIRFGVSPASRKVREIHRDRRMTVAYQHDPHSAYVTLLGEAVIETGLAERRQYWRDEFAAFFPAGPEGDDYVLIKFTPARIELMSFAGRVTGRPAGLKPAVLVRAGEAWQVEAES